MRGSKNKKVEKRDGRKNENVKKRYGQKNQNKGDKIESLFKIMIWEELNTIEIQRVDS